MEYRIFDDFENKGIILEFDMEEGLAIRLFIDDKAAQEMINIIQNKLDGRW